VQNARFWVGSAELRVKKLPITIRADDYKRPLRLHVTRLARSPLTILRHACNGVLISFLRQTETRHFLTAQPKTAASERHFCRAFRPKRSDANLL
jgi:hypothetical protein